MRSYIGQISAAPIPSDKRISPYDYCDEHWFNREVADFIYFEDCDDDALDYIFEHIGDAEKYSSLFPNVHGIGVVFKKDLKRHILMRNTSNSETRFRNCLMLLRRLLSAEGTWKQRCTIFARATMTHAGFTSSQTWG